MDNEQPSQEKKSNKSILITVIIVVVIGAAAAIYFFTQGDDENTNANTSQVNATTSTSPVNSDSDVSVVDYAIEMDEYSYSPSSIQIESGETIQVKITNTGSAMHNFLIDELGVNSGFLSPGEETIITITNSSTGSYSFYCSVGSHRQLGMEGTITVQ